MRNANRRTNKQLFQTAFTCKSVPTPSNTHATRPKILEGVRRSDVAAGKQASSSPTKTLPPPSTTTKTKAAGSGTRAHWTDDVNHEEEQAPRLTADVSTPITAASSAPTAQQAVRWSDVAAGRKSTHPDAAPIKSILSLP